MHLESKYAVETNMLSKRYKSAWALQNCSIAVPAGSITALVGPNGAGKSTLLKQIVGLNNISSGIATVLGKQPSSEAAFASSIGYLAQGIPLYKDMNVNQLSQIAKYMNRTWDSALVTDRLKDLNIPVDQTIGTLSGGQQAQVALTLTLAKHPKLLVLDEPIAAVDPLARQAFLSTLGQAVADSNGELTVLLSSHLLSDLEKICDHLIVLTDANVQLTGDIDEIITSHKLLMARAKHMATNKNYKIISETVSKQHITRLVKLKDTTATLTDWQIEQPNLEEIILAYMQRLKTSATVEEAK